MPCDASRVSLNETLTLSCWITALSHQAAFLRWFSRCLLASLYPGAPFARKSSALMLLNLLLSVWGSPDKHMCPADIGSGGAKASRTENVVVGSGSGKKSSRAETLAVAGLVGAVREAEEAAGERLFCAAFLGRPMVDMLLGSFPAPFFRLLLYLGGVKVLPWRDE